MLRRCMCTYNKLKFSCGIVYTTVKLLNTCFSCKMQVDPHRIESMEMDVGEIGK